MSVQLPAASVVFAGFRETGKTTFLVALWHTVLKKQVPGALTLEHFYQGDREYVQARYAEWLEYEAVKRTVVDHSTPILMTLRDHQGGRLLQLGIPDLSGETFKAQFEERRATQNFASAIRGATGIAIFINPEGVKDPTKIREAWDALDDEDKASASVQEPQGARSENGSEPDGGSPIAGTAQNPAESHQPPPSEGASAQATELPQAEPVEKKRKHFEPALCCTQVKYVDLLQQLAEYGASTPLRCAVIVSAMDTLDGTPFEDRPEDFIRARMSLLDQFLRTRRDLFQSRIYGVSAQGGKYDSASIDALSKLGTRRIRVCTNGTRGNDISLPVRWLAFGDE